MYMYIHVITIINFLYCNLIPLVGYDFTAVEVELIKIYIILIAKRCFSYTCG